MGFFPVKFLKSQKMDIPKPFWETWPSDWPLSVRRSFNFWVGISTFPSPVCYLLSQNCVKETGSLFSTTSQQLVRQQQHSSWAFSSPSWTNQWFFILSSSTVYYNHLNLTHFSKSTPFLCWRDGNRHFRSNVRSAEQRRITCLDLLATHLLIELSPSLPDPFSLVPLLSPPWWGGKSEKK